MRFVHLVQKVGQQRVLLRKMAASPSLWLPRISPSHLVVAKEDIGNEQLVLWRSTGCSWHMEGLSSNIMTSNEKLNSVQENQAQVLSIAHSGRED